MTDCLPHELGDLLGDAKRFQQLTEEDRAIFRAPELISLDPPETNDPLAQEKRRKWLEWRAAPYPASRHSEYLLRLPGDLDGPAPRILISAVLDPAAGIDAYMDGLDKKRRYQVEGRKARNMGYTTTPIAHPRDQAEAIHAIIHSSTERQGRAIAPMFDQRPADHAFPDYDLCDDPNYRDICTGVFAPNGSLAAYLLGKRVGDHVQYDEIMGHADHLAHDVMYLLHFAFLRQCLEQEIVPRCLNYGPWYSGQDPYSASSGLNFWKRKTRFRPAYLITVSS
jgi:hypothetical protein